MPTSCGSRYVPGLVALCALVCWPAISEAHFILQSPPAATEQNALGDPQKAPPCGDNGNAVPTNIVTTYQAGSTITVTIDETIFHPGHYRIALAADESELPEPPPVTPGTTPCGSAPIDPAPVFPVLADGVFEHTEPFAEPQSIDITLPDDVTCTNCTLQIIQFMSDHALNDPGGCYYHHCASIALEADPVEGTSSSGDGGGEASSGGNPPATSSADDTAGNGEATTGGGEDTGNTSAATSAASETDPGQAPADMGSGCSCSLPAGGSGMKGPLGMLVGLLGLMGLRLRRRRS